MKKILLILICFMTTITIVNATELGGTDTEYTGKTKFDDANFLKCIYAAYKEENGTEITDGQPSELTWLQRMGTIKNLNCENTSNKKEDKIVSLKGIENLTSLESLNLKNNAILDIDLSNNKELKTLYISNNKLLTLNLKNIALKTSDINNQNREFVFSLTNNKYELNLKDYDTNFDKDKVIFKNIDGVFYDKTTGLFTITKSVSKITYYYITNLSDMGSSSVEWEYYDSSKNSNTSEVMEVNLNITYKNNDVTDKNDIPTNDTNDNNSDDNNYVDERADSVQTGGIYISGILILLVISFSALILKYNKNHKMLKM